MNVPMKPSRQTRRSGLALVRASALGLTLVLAALALPACHEVSPTAPEVEIEAPETSATDFQTLMGMGGGGGGGTVSATFEFTFAPGLDLDGPVAQETIELKSSSTQVGVRDYPLDMTFFTNESEVIGGSVCFSTIVRPGAFRIDTQKKNDPSQGARVTYFFDALGNDGTTVLLYLLELDGVFDDPANWPPQSIDDIVNVSGGSYEIGPSAKGQKNKACSTVGALSYEVAVKRVS